MRSNYRRRDTEALNEGDGATAPSAEERVRAAELYRALEELEPKLRMVVVLYDLEGCTMKEVGRILGRPLATVQSQLATGRSRLAKALMPNSATAVASKSRTEGAE
jgi:RNA polymerase sigma factor (sigma-70 family)